MKLGKAFIVLSALVLGAFVWPMAAPADPVPEQPQWRDVPHPEYKAYQVKGPIYNPASKSYFELHYFVHHGEGTQGGNWATANELASQTRYNGVAGHLAYIKTYETHEFLLKHFRGFRETWIGMRVHCKPLRAYWEDGSPVDEQEFNAWDLERWYRSYVACKPSSTSKDWMGVYYKPLASGFRWQAAASPKRFEFFFVEYPTGKP